MFVLVELKPIATIRHVHFIYLSTAASLSVNSSARVSFLEWQMRAFD
jgi:hypothetical protein